MGSPTLHASKEGCVDAKSRLQKAQLVHYRKYGKFARAISWAVDVIATFKPQHPTELAQHAAATEEKLIQKGVGGKDRDSYLAHWSGRFLFRS